MELFHDGLGYSTEAIQSRARVRDFKTITRERKHKMIPTTENSTRRSIISNPTQPRAVPKNPSRMAIMVLPFVRFEHGE
jgi:hypothetical protein